MNVITLLYYFLFQWYYIDLFVRCFLKIIISFSIIYRMHVFQLERGNVNKTGCGFNSKDNIADYCTSTSLVPGRSALRSAAHGDIVVPSHRTDWGSRSFAVAGPSSWNALPVDLRSSSFGLDAFAKHLKTHLFGLAYSRQSTHFWVCITFCRVRHGDCVTKPDYYYYYYY